MLGILLVPVVRFGVKRGGGAKVSLVGINFVSIFIFRGVMEKEDASLAE